MQRLVDLNPNPIKQQPNPIIKRVASQDGMVHTHDLSMEEVEAGDDKFKISQDYILQPYLRTPAKQSKCQFKKKKNIRKYQTAVYVCVCTCDTQR